MEGHNPIIQEIEGIEEEFWCHDCDGRKVNGKNPETGRFFSVFGHIRRYDSQKKKMILTAEYEQVVFALCPDCLSVRGSF